MGGIGTLTGQLTGDGTSIIGKVGEVARALGDAIDKGRGVVDSVKGAVDSGKEIVDSVKGAVNSGKEIVDKG